MNEFELNPAETELDDLLIFRKYSTLLNRPVWINEKVETLLTHLPQYDIKPLTSILSAKS